MVVTIWWYGTAGGRVSTCHSLKGRHLPAYPRHTKTSQGEKHANLDYVPPRPLRSDFLRRTTNTTFFRNDNPIYTYNTPDNTYPRTAFQADCCDTGDSALAERDAWKGLDFSPQGHYLRCVYASSFGKTWLKKIYTRGCVISSPGVMRYAVLRRRSVNPKIIII